MTIDEQAKEIVAKMSLEEKASLLSGDGTWKIKGSAKYGFKPVIVHDGPCGLRKADEDAPDDASIGSLPATCFPSSCLLACSWDPALLEKVGQGIAYECIANQTDVILGPGVNIKRNPLCGRNFEYFSEDPLLAGKLAVGYINGVQKQGVGVSLKHFALNNQETHRFSYSAVCDSRAMREIYLKPFEIAVREAQPWTIMCSYNKINGCYSSDNEWLLTDILRKEWGFAGLVESDWGATNNSVYSHASGMDVEMPCYEKYAKPIARAIRKGQLSASRITEEAERVVALSLKCQHKIGPQNAFNEGMAFEVAKEAAEKSIVLLKNDGDLLPIGGLKGCCVIGALAKTPRYQGAGSSRVNPKKLVDFLSAANASRSSGNEIPFAMGYRLHDSDGDPKAMALEAVDLAHASKTVILFLGLPEEYEAEGFDRLNMLLPVEQIDLFNAIYKVNKNIVVVLSCGAPVELPFASQARSIVLGYLAGEATGPAIYDILTGVANPSGKLPETWPLHYNDVPSQSFYPLTGDNSLYKESIFVGYRYYLSAKRDVLYPFGFGLSYTSFAYSDLKVTPDVLTAKGQLSISFKITNTGKKEGEEVAELYIGSNSAKSLIPARELRFFTKINLKPGKSATVKTTISFSDFSHYDMIGERFEVEEGTYSIDVGSSSSNISLSAPVVVKSAYKVTDRRGQLSTYYNLPNKGFLLINDEEFEALLGYPIPVASRPKKQKYTLASSLRDISGTWIGKKVIGVAEKKIVAPGTTEQQKQQLMDMTLDAPLRFVTMMGLKVRVGVALADLANKRPLKAVFDYLFWHYK
jgi:beta-glucosidase